MLEILHNKVGLVAVNKPAGIRTTGNSRFDEDCVEFQLAKQLGRPTWAVHQLDKGTTGVCLFVTKRSLVAEWSAELAAGQKHYLALVQGIPEWTELVASEPMIYVEALGRPWVDASGKHAETRFVRGDQREETCLVHAYPRTGRTHQIRVHLAYRGFPLVGERLHAPDAPAAATENHCLHLADIEMRTLNLCAPLPVWAR